MNAPVITPVEGPWFNCTAIKRTGEGFRHPRCGKPATHAVFEATEIEGVDWEPVCGIHKRTYLNRNLKGEAVADLFTGNKGTGAMVDLVDRPDIVEQLTKARDERKAIADARAAKRKAESDEWHAQAVARKWLDADITYEVVEDEDRIGRNVLAVQGRIGDKTEVGGHRVGSRTEFYLTEAEGEPAGLGIVNGPLVPENPSQARAYAQALLRMADAMDAINRAQRKAR